LLVADVKKETTKVKTRESRKSNLLATKWPSGIYLKGPGRKETHSQRVVKSICDSGQNGAEMVEMGAREASYGTPENPIDATEVHAKARANSTSRCG
jgi:hypothetical protein